MTLHTVVFDAGMTLIQPRPTFSEAFARACTECGHDVSADAVRAAAHLWREHHDVWLDTGMPDPFAGDEEAEAAYFRELYRRFLDELGVADEDGVADHVLQRLSDPDSYWAFPEVEEVLDALDGRGVRLGLISNWGTLVSLREILERIGIRDRFAVVVVSGEEGMAKPDPRIFRLALERLGEEPSPHVAYVGDDLIADVAPARALGLTPILVDRGGRFEDHDGPRVTDLRGLLDLVAP